MSSKFSRVLAVVAALALSLVLAACGGDDGDSTNGSADADAASSSDFSGTTISYMGFGGYLDEQVKKVWMDPFTEETGAEFTLDSPTDYAKLEAQVKSGNVSYDVADADGFMVGPQCGTLFEETGVSQENVLEPLRINSECGVATYAYGIGMYYDKSAFPDGGPQNCEDFFDVDKFPGQRVIWTYVAAAGAVECAAIANGADPTDPYPIDIDEAFAKLETIKDDLGGFDSSGQVVDGMVNSDAPIYMATTRNYIDALDKGADYGLAEGFLGRGSGTLALIKDAPNAEAAKAWIAYVLQPEVNQKIGPAAPPYPGATGGETPDNWSDAAKQVDVVSGPHADDAFTADQDWWAKHYDEVSQRYTALLSG